MNYIYDINNNDIIIDNDYLSKIEEKIKLKKELQDDEIDYYLSVLLSEMKKRLDNISIDDSYKGLCSYAQCALHYHLEKLDVKHYMHRTIKTIDKDCTDHYFLIADFNIMGEVKSYILDPTYRQFFIKDICLKDDVRNPGKYYLNHQEYESIITDFLKKGYILIEDNILKMYGDSFYYSKKMPEGFKSELPLYIYEKLFKKEDGVIAKDEDYLSSLGLLPVIPALEKRL